MRTTILTSPADYDNATAICVINDIEGKPPTQRTDMQDRIKELAVEAGGVPMRENCLDAEAFPWGVEMEIDALERFAQAVARECAEIVEAKSVSSYRATELAANAIRARFGLGE